MSPADAIKLLHYVNGKLRSAIERFLPDRHSCLAIQSDDLSNLLADLVRAGECLREADANFTIPASRLQLEVSEYRSNLEEVERLLPDFYRRLLTEKSRLVEAQQHLDRAADWAGRNQNTL